MPEHTLSELQKRMVQQMQLQGAQGANPLTPSTLGTTFNPGSGTEEVSKRVGATMGLDAMLSDPAIVSPVLAAGVRFLISGPRGRSFKPQVLGEGFDDPTKGDMFKIANEMKHDIVTKSEFRGQPTQNMHIRGVLDETTGKLFVGRADQVLHQDLVESVRGSAKRPYLLDFQVTPIDQKVHIRNVSRASLSPEFGFESFSGTPLKKDEVLELVNKYPALMHVLGFTEK